MIQNDQPIYLDYQATTPVDPVVLEAMNKANLETFGNTSSGSHVYGWNAEGLLRAARTNICDQLNIADPLSLTFTSGATEANNWVIQKTNKTQYNTLHFISQVTEHKSILEPLYFMQSLGHELTLLPVDADGFVNGSSLQNAFKPNTVLVSIMMANNEIGTLQDIENLAHITHTNSQALFHTDATQAVGRIPVDIKKLGVDFLSFSAHKFYGPKGVGALYHKTSTTKDRLSPLILGGGHEFGYRAGTVNTPSIHGMSMALDLCIQEIPQEGHRLQKLSDKFLSDIQDLLNQGVKLNGSKNHRLPHNLSLTMAGIPSNVLLAELSSFALSAGSACATGGGTGSYVIRALRGKDEDALSTLRISMGRWTKQDDMDKLARELKMAFKKFKGMGF